MPMATTAKTTAARGSSQRSSGRGAGASEGTKTANRAAATPRKTELMAPSVTHRPIAERDSGQAGSRTGGGGAVIPAILAVRGSPSSTPCHDGGVMPQQVPTVPASELPEDAVVLDVREDDEWVHGHIEGATHVPMGDVPSRLEDLPEGDPLYVTCRSGGRSARVAARLNQNGRDAVNVGGGMGEWEAGGRPLASENGAPPYVVWPRHHPRPRDRCGAAAPCVAGVAQVPPTYARSTQGTRLTEGPHGATGVDRMAARRNGGRLSQAIGSGVLALTLTAASVALVLATAAPRAEAAQTPTSCSSTVALTNGDFEQPVVPDNSGPFLQDSQVPGWYTSASDHAIELWSTPYYGVTAGSGRQFAELNANMASTLYQDGPTTPGQTLRWQLLHRGRAGTDVMAVVIGKPNTALVSQGNLTDGKTAWGAHSG